MEEGQEIHWKPNPGPQTLCLELEDVDEKLFGGGRGGGKSDAGMVWLVHPDYISNPRYRGLVIRRNFTDLSDWIDRARWMYRPLHAEFSGNPVEIVFPSGARIRTGHLRDEGAYTKYQGHEYQRVLIEELTHIPSEDLYEKLIQSCRSTIPELPPRVLCTTNPDGVGRNWVKRRFVATGRASGEVFTTPVEERTRVYIQSTVKDNPFLMQSKHYLRSLEGITDPDLRKAWLEGDWDSFTTKGAVYGDLLVTMRKEGRIKSVPCERFFPVDTYWDLGYDDATAILFVQSFAGERRLIDYYEMSGMDVAHYISVLRSKKDYTYGVHWLPWDCKVHSMQTGRSTYEVMHELMPHDDIRVVPRIGSKAQSEVADGINAVRMLCNTLWIDSAKCARFIEAMENYHREWDEELLVYRPKPVHDWTSHAMDCLRYMAVSSLLMQDETEGGHRNARGKPSSEEYFASLVPRSGDEVIDW